MIVTLLGDFWWLSVLTTLTVSLDLTFLKISAKRFLVIPKRNSPEIIFQKQNLHQESSCFKTASIYLFIYGLNIFRSKSISRLQVKVKGKLLSLPHQNIRRFQMKISLGISVTSTTGYFRNSLSTLYVTDYTWICHAFSKTTTNMFDWCETSIVCVF